MITILYGSWAKLTTDLMSPNLTQTSWYGPRGQNLSLEQVWHFSCSSISLITWSPWFDRTKSRLLKVGSFPRVELCFNLFPWCLSNSSSISLGIFLFPAESSMTMSNTELLQSIQLMLITLGCLFLHRQIFSLEEEACGGRPHLAHRLYCSS